MGDSKIQISATTFGVGLGFVAAISITLGGAVAYAVTHYTGTRTCACDDYESSVRAKLQKRKKNMSRYTLPAEYSSGSVHDYKTDCRHIEAIGKEKLELYKMINGKPYNADDPLLQEMLTDAHELCYEYNRLWNRNSRKVILEGLLGKFSQSNPPYVEAPVYVDYGLNIEVGKNFYANFGCVLLDCAKIHIGDNVMLAPNVQLYTAGHPTDYVERRSVEFAQPITIGNDVWIGGGSIVLPGVSIGDRTIVAAGSVVTKNIPSDVIIAGIPAKIVRFIGERQIDNPVE
eukprot:CAMPEP_0204837562 /NCGR_PEP_ID=MMETSP1346-20131115/28272_1 /ASSEMBLY_ACC=CAM_ASM_000771 /TAXON_ID=215587 /ORGANISM="Aplanochytrium stocchinoi, Strain GSBS06" /LENGTH=286 /DNA_ID=CAMNT_0051973073 /DNA_START=42 /DNA_END=902 /DNA_ORIENTATION=-